MKHSEVTFEELFALDEIQRIQDDFAAATRVASIITRPDGTPITAPSNFTYFCEHIIRRNEIGCANCYKSDAALGGITLNDVTVMQCLSAGLWDAGVPIVVGGHHVANWLIGQVRDETQTDQKALAYAKEIGADKAAFLSAFREVPVMPVEQFKKVVQALHSLARELSTKAFQNLQLVQSEARLRELATEQQAILDGADYAIIATDINGVILRFNKAAQRMLGYSPEEVIGKQTPELIHDRAEIAARARELSADLGIPVEPGFEVFSALPRRGQAEEREWSYIDKLGRRLPVRLSITPLHGTDGEITGYMGIAADLSERKQEQYQMELLRRAINLSNDAIYLTDDQFHFVYTNSTACKQLGYSQDELLALGPKDIDCDEGTGNFRKILLSSPIGTTLTVERRHRTRNGRFIPVEICISHVEHGGKRFSLAVARDISERKEAESRLRDSEARYLALFEGTSDGIYLLTDRVIDCNPAAVELLGYSREEILGATPTQHSPVFQPDGRSSLEKANEKIAAAMAGSTQFFEWEFVRKDGSKLDAEVALNSVEIKGVSHLLATVRDSRKRKQAEAKLRDSEARYRTLFEGSSDGIALYCDGRFVDCNPAMLRIFGGTRDEIIGSSPINYSPLFQPDGRSSEEAAFERIRAALGGKTQIFEWVHMKCDGTPFDVEVSLNAVEIGGVSHVLATMRDISERKQNEEKIERLAYYDQLTQLPNRSLLLNRLEKTMSANEQNGLFSALLLVDLDDFKTLNDSRGHECGDLLLKQAGERLQSLVLPEDTVARIGGDEFLIMLVDLGPVEEVAAVRAETTAQKISNALNQTFHLGLEDYRNSSSIGVCVFEGNETDSETLMRQVELAMYRAKGAGRNLIRFFDPAMEASIARRAGLVKDMQIALQEQQFELYYQPQVAGGKLVGAETLVRWRHPQRGMISPGDFIPLAEETGIIVPLGLWVLKSACLQLSKWGSRPGSADLQLAVNVSVQQFIQDDFVQHIVAVLHETGANPVQLKLELTESLMASDIDDIIEKMHALKAHGIRFSLDDFGTGYSSMSMLKRLPFDQLKIDQSFVHDLLVDNDDAMIAKTIITLGESLEIEVIAEGVETAEHFVSLAGLGCKVFQGYFYGRPMPIAEFEQRQDFLSLHENA